MTLFALLLSAALAASAQTPAAGLTRIGAAAAVKGVVNAQAPGQAVGRVLNSGKPVFLNDHVTTGAAGRLQVMLLDETVFTIGPNSDMVLDEFVYDPVTSAGKVTAQVTKGVFRFVTGKVARKDPGSMRVKLPVGTIGIRGTIAGGEASQGGSTVILFGPGAQNNADENPGSVSVGNAGSEVVISQPGFGTTISPGQAPGAVMDMSGQAAQISNALGEPAPQGGGGSGGGSAGGSAGQQAGQDTAAGGVSAGISGALGDFTGTLDVTQTLASQQAATSGIANGISTWDQVRGILTGTGHVTGVGSYACWGGSLCSSGGSGTFDISVDVDFANRTIGGGISSLGVLSGSLTSNPWTNINSSSFASQNLSSPLQLSVSNSEFSGTTAVFMNRDGVIAKDLAVTINFLSTLTTDSATGTAVGAVPGR